MKCRWNKKIDCAMIWRSGKAKFDVSGVEHCKTCRFAVGQTYFG